jgi:hypothetical protein
MTQTTTKKKTTTTTKDEKKDNGNDSNKEKDNAKGKGIYNDKETSITFRFVVMLSFFPTPKSA